MRYRLVLILFTVLLTSVTSAENLLNNWSFENTSSLPTGHPTSFGYWKGDVTNITGTSDGINPFDGDQMLKFVYGDTHSSASQWGSCNVVQLVDLSQFSDLISSGDAIVNLSAFFNRVSGDSQTDTAFDLDIFAMTGSSSSYANYRDTSHRLEWGHTTFSADDNISTWEMLTMEFTIPVGTQYLGIEILATENIFNDYSGTEFDGHYADAISLTIVPEPATFAFLAVGAVSLLRRKK